MSQAGGLNGLNRKSSHHAPLTNSHTCPLQRASGRRSEVQDPGRAGPIERHGSEKARLERGPGLTLDGSGEGGEQVARSSVSKGTEVARGQSARRPLAWLDRGGGEAGTGCSGQ